MDEYGENTPNISAVTEEIYENRKTDVKYVKNALENHEDDLFMKLVKKNYRVNDDNEYEESVLHIILRRYPYTAYTLNICGVLAENNANLFKQNISKQTPWHMIAESCDIRMFREAMKCTLVRRYNNKYALWREEKGKKNSIVPSDT